MSKYESLRRHLQGISSDVWRATFADVEAVLGFKLPESARKYPAWWANQIPPLSQTSSWIGAGWQTDDVDLGSYRVTFHRTGSPSLVVPLAPVSTQHKSAIVPSHKELDRSPPAWDSPDRVTIQAQFEWKPIGRIGLDHARRLAFPQVPSSPGLYRFRVLLGDKEALYIGETENLSRRFGHYRNPGPSQETNIRLNEQFIEALVRGGEISVAIVAENSLIDLGDGLISVDLKSKMLRLMLENAALLVKGKVGVALLNRRE